MIKNLLNADEEIAVKPERVPEAGSIFGDPGSHDVREVPAGISGIPLQVQDEPGPESHRSETVADDVPAIVIDRKPSGDGVGVQSFLFEDPVRPAPASETLGSGELGVSSIFVAERHRTPDPAEFPPDPPPISFRPPSKTEVIRRSGLAWSAGIVFFGSVVFMLILGWLADLLFGSSPVGLVGGIVVGSLIGFVQLFRISSQILKQ